MAGILDYKRYLNTLQTLTEVGNIFPGDQKTYTFTVGGSTSTSTQGWTATVSWETLVIDEMTYDKNNRPDFTGSKVLGIYTGTSISQFTTGTILVPANMYTGPVLPAHTVNVPVTVVNIAWTKDGDIFANNIAYIQNWEPGVPLGDPATGDGYEPVVSEPSTLTLTGPGGVVFQRSIELKAQTDIPLFLGTTTRCYFYWDKAGGRELLGISFFDPNTNTATLNYNTSGTQFTGGTYPIYAEFNGFRQYGFARSNTLQQVVISHIPLIVDAESISPVQSTYLIGDNVAYSLRVRPDPSFPQTGVPVSNDVRIFRRNTGTVRSANVILSTTTFVNGIVGVAQSVTTELFNITDTDGFSGNDSVSVSTSTLTANTFTVTLSVKNYWNFDTQWDTYLDGPYASGSRVSAQYTTEYLPVKTITGEAYPITLAQNTTSFLTELTTFRITKPPRFHGGNIKLMGRKGNDEFTELSSFANGFTAPTESLTIDTLTTGTWTLYASFAGDLGTGYFNAFKNLASTSNTITHVVTLGQDLPVFLTYQRTNDYDIVRAVATYNFSDTRQMPKYVSFFQGESFLNTASWVRSTSTSISITTSTLYESSTAYLDSFSDLQGGFQNPNKFTMFRAPYFESTSTYLANPLEVRVNFPAVYYPPVYRGVDSMGRPIVVGGDYTTDAYTIITAGAGGSYNVIALQRQLENAFPRVLTVNGISITLTSYIGQYGSKFLYRIQRALPVLSTRYLSQQSSRTANFYGSGLPTRALGGKIGDLYLMINYGYLYQRTSSDISLPAPFTINRFGGKEFQYEWYNPKPITSGPYSNGGLWNTTGWSYIGEDGAMAADFANGQKFGIKEWTAANPANATQVADAEYYNRLYTALQQKALAVVTTATTETPNIFTVYAGQHVAELKLPIGTIFNGDIVRATWPGTLDLDRSFGKLNPFDIGTRLAPSETRMLPLTMATVDAHINPHRVALPDSPYWANPTVISTTETSFIYSTNPVNLKVSITVDNGGYPGQDSGTVTFYRVDTNQDIGTVSVTSGTATLSITADDIPGVALGITTSTTIGARFDGALSADSTSTNFITATVVRSAFDKIPYQFSRYMKNELGQDAGNDFTIPVVPYIPPTIVKTILRSDYPQFQTPGRQVSISGSYFDIQHPITSFRGICSAYENQDIYGQAFNRRGYWDRTSNFYFVFRYTVVGGVYDGQVGWIVPPEFSSSSFNLMFYIKSDTPPNAGPGLVRYTMRNIISRTSGNSNGKIIVGGFGGLDWIADWTRIDIDISAVGADYYAEGVSSMSSGVKLGIQGVWNIT